MRQTMKAFGMAACMAMLAACSTHESDVKVAPSDVSSERVSSPETSHRCASMDVLATQLKEHPELARQMQTIETQTRQFTEAQRSGRVEATGTIEIPVYIHVIYNTAKPQENISMAQINSQMTVLNADFQATNTDIGKTPQAFKSRVGKMDMRFVLKSVSRKASSRANWGLNDAMKKPSQGGVAPITPSKALNIWVCHIGSDVLGYAQFPGGGPASTDGVVISPQFFGTTGYVQAPFNKGRTATHEVGHWINLYHIWGDNEPDCGNDLVNDTPQSSTPNYGCPSYPTVHCGSADMTMNYMDYTDDPCMYMFSKGQVTRARAVFAAGGPRSGF